MLTMVLGGLWHGAAWPFVLWGFFHGVGAVHRARVGGAGEVPGWLRWLVTFHLVVFGWILFRSTTSSSPATTSRACSTPGPATLFTVPVALMILVVIGLQLLPERDGRAGAGAHRAVTARVARVRGSRW